MKRRLLGVAVLALALSSCGGEPKADPSPTRSVTTPVSTTPTAPVMPDAAKANTKAGAIAFVRHYVDLVNYAQQTGDVSTLASVESDACESCAKVRRSIAEIYTAGGAIQGGTWHPHFKVALHNGDGSWLVTGYIKFEAEEVRSNKTAEPQPQPGGSAVTHLTVKNSDDAWKVLAWSRES
jgi:hypothetical protein